MNMIYPAMRLALAGMLLLVAASGTALAQRETVLKQIQVPHNVYYREMYLPQLTTIPSSLAWSPDGRSLVYSMQGSLWRQRLDSGVAQQLTSGPGYDYQPDWSPDGSTIVFVRYENDALELHTLHLDSGEVTALTGEGAVNIEPRWSPDGSKIAFVSTRDNGRFHLYVGDYAEDALSAGPLFEERQSEIYRYYYSSYDHELSPAWSPDGSEILYVGNPEIPYRPTVAPALGGDTRQPGRAVPADLRRSRRHRTAMVTRRQTGRLRDERVRQHRDRRAGHGGRQARAARDRRKALPRPGRLADDPHR